MTMPLPHDQQRALEEITARARRIYRHALKMQTEQRALQLEQVAELYVDSKVVQSYTDMLWRQTSDTIRGRDAYAERSDPADDIDPEIQAEHD